MLELLAASLQGAEVADFGELEQIGLAKSFELSFELMWKLIKDYLEYQGVEIGITSPKNVLRVAATSGLLELIEVDGDTLLAAHKTRNELTHVYSEEAFREALGKVKLVYLADMLKIDRFFGELARENG
jgi:nucleotidyltransferase substrate binding protein (TIGR01987 family)